jgi:hypothetical protein
MHAGGVSAALQDDVPRLRDGSSPVFLAPPSAPGGNPRCPVGRRGHPRASFAHDRGGSDGDHEDGAAPAHHGAARADGRAPLARAVRSSKPPSSRRPSFSSRDRTAVFAPNLP